MYSKLLGAGLITGLMSATAFAEPPIQPGDTLESLSKAKVVTTVNGQPGSLQDIVASGQVRIVSEANPQVVQPMPTNPQLDVIPADARHIPLSISFSSGESQGSMKPGSKDDVIKLLLENAGHPAVQNMCTGMYDMIFFEEPSQQMYRKFFEDLVTADPKEGAVLWHCTQGKDRAGCASAMLLAALGADRTLIMADYILSQDYYAPAVSRIPVQTEEQKAVINTLIGANPVIFEAALDKIDAQYGSFDNYLEECIGVTEQMKQTLRERYLK